jgi:hypothetical protein
MDAAGAIEITNFMNQWPVDDAPQTSVRQRTSSV